MTTNRIDEILREVRTEIDQKRFEGRFEHGYEASIEDQHNRELGKRSQSPDAEIEELQAALAQLRQQVSGISGIERDTVRFAPLRFIRELAMSRHQLIRLNDEVRDIAATIESLASGIVAKVLTRTSANEQASQELLNLVFERTLVMDKLIVVCRELESRIENLENS